ncbi:MAG: hypothetical protein AB7O45_12100 [Alphaproteobacteria bacterium]
MIALFRDDWLRKIFFAIGAAAVIATLQAGDLAGLPLVAAVAALIAGAGWYIRWIMDRAGYPPDRSAPVRRDAPLRHYVWLLPAIYLAVLFLRLTA